ncbi:MAG: M23 family metallopeptidase [Actinomycetia bacterium]|nr:M23 family metallopeptidase [Actinomycetes bacterium]
MPSHARLRPALISRPSTVIALSLAVSSLSLVTLVHAPGQAIAGEPSIADPPVTRQVVAAKTNTSAALSIVDLERSRIARLAGMRAERGAKRDRTAARQLRQQREARQQRQERRAKAQAAARAERRAPEWVMPVPGAGMSAYFGEAGSAWSSGYHTGQDFTAVAGTPVHAVGSGTITSATWSDAYGNIIEITHANGDQSWYAHMSSFERTSGSVSAGDVIGYIGCTGNCFGTHLHFEYHPGGGEAADPLPWLRRNGAY